MKEVQGEREMKEKIESHVGESSSNKSSVKK